MKLIDKFIQLERYDCLNNPIKWYRYTIYVLIPFCLGVICIFICPTGFSGNVLETLLNVVAILTGFLVTALVYAADNLYQPRIPFRYLLDVELSEESLGDKKGRFFIQETIHQSESEKIVDKKLLYYANKSIYIIGTSIIVSILLLVLVVLQMLVNDTFAINISDYHLVKLSWQSFGLAIKIGSVLIVRFLVIALLSYVLMNIVRVLVNLIKFSDIKHDNQNGLDKEKQK